jgi:hypothetical protein
MPKAGSTSNLTEEARIDLVLTSQQYLAGLAKVEGQTDKTQKAVEKAFMKLSTDANRAAASYDMLGDQSKKLATDQKAIQSAIDALIRGGLSKQSPQVQALIADYKKLGTASESVENKNRTLGQSFASLRDVMQGPVAAAKMVFEALERVVKVGSDLYMEYAGAERGVNVFNQAMKESLQISSSGATALKEYAAELENKVGLDAEDTMAMMGKLAVMGKTERQILDISEAAANYSAGAGIDFKTAFEQLNGTLQGSARGLDRQNGAIKALTKEQLMNGDAIKIINEQYKDYAEITGKDALGASERLNRSTIVLKEALGEVVAYNFKPLIENMVTAAKEAADRISQKTNLGKVLSGDTKNIDAINQAYMYQSDLMQTQRDKIDEINAANRGRSSGEQKDAEKKLADLQKQLDALRSIQKEMSTMSAISDKAKAAALAKAQKEEESAKRAEARQAQETFTYQGMLHERQANYEAYYKALTDAAKRGEEEIANFQKSLGGKMPEHEGIETELPLFYRLLQSNELTNANDRFNKSFDESTAYIDAVQKKADELGISFEEAAKKMADAPITIAGAIEGISGAWNAAQGAMGAYGDLVQNQGDAEIAAMKARGATDEEIKKKQNEIAEKAFNANKANAIANALISGYEATMKAYAQLGPLGGTVGAAIVAAMSAAQVGMIAAQSYVPMAEGGSGTVTKPTLFLAGEAGAEDFAFGPKRKGGLSGGGTTVIQNFNIGGSVIAERQVMQLGAAGVAMAGRGY